jgi:F-type H+-transporting ATPase subunit delta
LTGKDVVVTTEVDEDIIGGIVIQIGDQLLDGSTRTHLEALRKRVRSGIS